MSLGNRLSRLDRLRTYGVTRKAYGVARSLIQEIKDTPSSYGIFPIGELDDVEVDELGGVSFQWHTRGQVVELTVTNTGEFKGCVADDNEIRTYDGDVLDTVAKAAQFFRSGVA